MKDITTPPDVLRSNTAAHEQHQNVDIEKMISYKAEWRETEERETEATAGNTRVVVLRRPDIAVTSLWIC
jgi:hypothetical protein